MQTKQHTFQQVAEEIARRVVVTRSTADAAYISLPMVYVSGTSVVVRIIQEHSYAGEPPKFVVSDCAIGYDEAASLGVETIFARQAKETAARFGVKYEGRAISVSDVGADQLTSACIAIANCSAEAVAIVAERVDDSQGDAASELLYRRLVSVFSPRKVSRNVEVVGSSTTVWNVGNLVNVDDGSTIFEAVSAHRNSIYAATIKFRDIAESENAIPCVAVVKQKADLKTMNSILSQSARVVESGVGNEVLQRIAYDPLLHGGMH